MDKKVYIGNKPVGSGASSYIIAEIGFNHGGDVNLASRMIEAAAGAGVDAVKFQTFYASNLVLESMEHFRLIKDTELSAKDHELLADVARGSGVDFFSTPFCEKSAAMLENLNVPVFKVASMDITNIPLLRCIARFKKPMIVSTGMASIEEIAETLEVITQEGNNQIVLLHCISQYPAPAENTHLRIMMTLHDIFGVPVGFSDHSLGNALSLAAVALGASVIEKHFTLDKNLPGPDHAISADPLDMKQLVDAVRTIEKGLGDKQTLFCRPDRSETAVLRRGLYASRDIPAGAHITADMIKCVRPAKGLPPCFLETVIGRVARKTIPRETPITFDFI